MKFLSWQNTARNFVKKQGRLVTSVESIANSMIPAWISKFCRMIKLKINKIVMITHYSVHGKRQKSKENGKPHLILTTLGMDSDSPYWDALRRTLKRSALKRIFQKFPQENHHVIYMFLGSLWSQRSPMQSHWSECVENHLGVYAKGWL
jgi:hypothetical protein